jgi:hypothetical protein
LYKAPEEENPLIKESYLELIRLCEFYRHSGAPTVIGGWAVYFYNSYFGSVDIDLVSPSFRGSFSDILERYQRAFKYEILSIDTLGLQVIARKPVIKEGRLVGYIEIDACSTEDPKACRFHEDEEKQLPYFLCYEDMYRREVKISEKAYCYVPCKSLLLLYKLKALRDRSYDLRVKGATLPEDRVVWLRDKIVKDRADIIALTDPNPRSSRISGEVDSACIIEITNRTGTRFTLKTLEEASRDDLAIALYDPTLTKREVEGWFKKLINVLVK